MWSFAAPFGFLLLPLPVLASRAIRAQASQAAALFVPEPVAEGARTLGPDRSGSGVDRLLSWLLWLCLVTALAGPRSILPTDAIESSGRDIVLALDLSGSMEKEDFSLDGTALSRLAAVKRVAGQFVAGRSGDRIGLVVFGDEAYFAQPLTFDVAAVARAIDEAVIGISGRSTALSYGLGLAIKRLMRSDAPSRAVILLSDGIDTDTKTDPLEVGRLAAAHGIRVHTIALGPEDTETDPAGRDVVDARTLRAVAEAGGGESFRVRSMADLTAVADALDRLEPNPTKRPPLQVVHELWIYPASIALLLVVVLAFRRPSR